MAVGHRILFSVFDIRHKLCQRVSSVSELNPQLAPVALKRRADRMTGLWEFPPLRIDEPLFSQINKVN